MPTAVDILGFSNRWYPGAVDSAVPRDVDGMNIKVVDAVHFVATKVVAFGDRGNADFYASHDVEDILAVVDGRPELVDEIRSASDEVRSAIIETFRTWLEPADAPIVSQHPRVSREAIVLAPDLEVVDPLDLPEADANHSRLAITRS